MHIILTIGLLFSISAFAKEVTIYRDVPIQMNPNLVVRTYYDPQNFIGYHTVVTEDVVSNGQVVQILYLSRATSLQWDVSTQHTHAVFYALHLAAHQQLISQNPPTNHTIGEEISPDMTDLRRLYSIPEE